ncbi:hypothetical protein NH340_JMT06693 [Sarcoptes scabiei]|nr:hypothetical protein NH340_JMT06693 [Sarcoptes scabiei]
MLLLSYLTVLFASSRLVDSLAADKCEVCVGVLTKLMARLTSADRQDPSIIEHQFKELCLETKKAENRFCYYVGGLEESATKIVGEMSKPMSWGMPAEKICEKLKKKDSQICDLRYEKTIDWKTVDLKKLKVKDLRKILSDWDERCDGCIEKAEFIAKVEALKPKYVRDEL